MLNFENKVSNGGATSAGRLSHIEDNVRFRELENAVSSSGIALDDPATGSLDEYMLAQAIGRYASGGAYFTDSGSVNNHVLTATGDFIAPKEYFDGLVAIFYPGNNNSGASAINVNNIGSVPLKKSDGSDLNPGDVIQNRLVSARYNGQTGSFHVDPWSLASNSADGSFTNLPLYPEIKTDSGLLNVLTPSPGLISIEASDVIVYRGWKSFNIADYSISQRQFDTLSNKTYHLRWRSDGGFELKDLADNVYNPFGLPEKSEIFDTTVDDMLCAKIVTDSSNAITITKLINKAFLRSTIGFINHVGLGGTYQAPDYEDNELPETISNGVTVTRNWSRTGTGSFVSGTDFQSGVGEMNLGVWVRDRYEVIGFQQSIDGGTNGWSVFGEFKA